MKHINEKHSNLTINEVAELFHVASITVLNWVKEGLLEIDEAHLVTEESIARFKKSCAGKKKLHARANKQLKDGHDNGEVNRAIKEALLMEPFDDAMGDRYEAMLSESYKNREGVFYTPISIVEDMLQTIEVGPDTLFLDPCCGSGNFLVKAIEKGIRPQNLYGYDTDSNAVMIARRRIKAMTGCDAPNIVCADFLQVCRTLNVKFDMVFTNPPWGKKLSKDQRADYARLYQAGSSSDTCSLFLFSILSVMKPGGVIGMLMPDSFFKIAVYENARKAVLEQTILKIKDYGKPFKNMYSAVSLVVKQCKCNEQNTVTCCFDHQEFLRSQASFMMMPRHNLNYWTRPKEMKLVEELLSQPYLTLKGCATWGIGIVTGNNAGMCKHTQRKGLKPVYRGKDILPGHLKAASWFINPDDFPRYQQMASMDLLCAPVKLVYRFISSRLVFYCDTRQRFILNSANMLVLDKDFPLSASKLAEVMNSALTNWLFKQLFNTHKVLRSDLEMLPIITDSALHCRFDLLNLSGQALK